MSDVDSHTWRNVLLAGARGLEYTFGAIARALSGEQPVEASGKDSSAMLATNLAPLVGGTVALEMTSQQGLPTSSSTLVELLWTTPFLVCNVQPFSLHR